MKPAIEGNTIIGISIQNTPELKSMLLDKAPLAESADVPSDKGLVKIRAALSTGQRSSASILVNKMYATRGYLTSGALGENKDAYRMTLTASEHHMTIGTLTIGFDNPQGLMADDVFKPELDSLRFQGRRVCEFTKLAMESGAKSRRVLASLFRMAYIYAYRLHGFQDLVIEVNPRHVNYYKRILDFTVLAQERTNRRVKAPAVLMRLEFSHIEEKIRKFEETPELRAANNSLYAYVFSIAQEAKIVARLRQLASTLDSETVYLQ